MAFPTIPGLPSLPNVISVVVRVGSWLIDKLGNLKRPSEKETAEDVSERYEAYRQFCDQVRAEAREVETYAVQQVEAYGRYLSSLSEGEEYAFLKRYRVNPTLFAGQLNLVKAQIPGLISAEVSSKLNDSNPECMSILKMLPGSAKQQRMNEFLRNTIKDAVNNCADVTEASMEQMQDVFLDELQAAVDVSCQQLKQQEDELTQLSEASEDVVKRQKIQYRAKQTVACCDQILSLIG